MTEPLTPAIAEHDVTVYQGDVRAVLAQLPAESVNCVVTSPPYYGLRDYGCEGQIGLEASPAEYVETMRAVFADVRRVLRPDGVLWLNLGDSYYSGRGNPGPNSADEKQEARRGWVRALDRPGQEWAKPKDLLGVPWRVAFALQDDGWTLRNAIIWHKPNAMPESVTDRLSTRYEHVFLFSRSRRYWFDLDPIREPYSPNTESFNAMKARFTDARTSAVLDARTASALGRATDQNGGLYLGGGAALNELGRNPGDVWEIPTQPYAGAHFATMPRELVRRCILAGCPEDGTVLDPFTGSGTTAMVARSLGRRFVGAELNPDYIDIIRQRIGQTPLDFSEAVS